ncbi:MAG: hypothetical protein ACRYHC_01695 [Janthinobacterium lividum]
MDPLRKLLVLATNYLIESGQIDLASQEDVKGNLQANIGGRNSVITWNGIGAGEVRVSIWWDYEHDKHPQANLGGNSRERFLTSAPLAKRQHYQKFVGVVVSAWLERETGRYLQGTGRDFLPDKYVRRGALALIDALPDPVPLGFSAEGRKHL